MVRAMIDTDYNDENGDDDIDRQERKKFTIIWLHENIHTCL